MGKTSLLVFLLSLSFLTLNGQSPYAVNYQDIYHFIDRMNTIHGLGMDLSQKKLYGEDVILFAQKVNSIEKLGLDPRSRHFLQFLINEHSLTEVQKRGKVYVDSVFYVYRDTTADLPVINDPTRGKPLFGLFYRNPVHFYQHRGKEFNLTIDPIINFQIGSEKKDQDILFYNRRGIRLSGQLDKKIYFYTDILETQARFPSYIENYFQKFGTVPGAGFIKDYNSSILDFDRGRDFLLSNAYFGIAISKHVRLEFGHDHHFIGDGQRSLLLSNFATNYLYLKLLTTIGPIRYQNIFGELNASNERKGDTRLPRKYFAAHHLSISLSPKWSLGLFETVIFSRSDQFELQYLNPLILYRTVEGAIGSPDNVIIGIHTKYSIRQSRLFIWSIHFG